MDGEPELIDQICTIAGMIMEDASVAATVRDATPSVEARIASIAAAGRDIVVLAAAAEVLVQRLR